jgi:hypothetical protein
VTGTSWEHQREVRDALQTIVSDPQLGVPALSSAQTMSNLLKDLITDGLPTDPPGGFEAGLSGLISSAAGRASLRVAVAIGRDASSEPLNRFRSPDAPILVADSTDDIVDRLVAASIAVSRMSEEGADREALAQTLMQPPAGPAPEQLDDSIL